MHNDWLNPPVTTTAQRRVDKQDDVVGKLVRVRVRVDQSQKPLRRDFATLIKADCIDVRPDENISDAIQRSLRVTDGKRLAVLDLLRNRTEPTRSSKPLINFQELEKIVSRRQVFFSNLRVICREVAYDCRDLADFMRWRGVKQKEIRSRAKFCEDIRNNPMLATLREADRRRSCVSSHGAIDSFLHEIGRRMRQQSGASRYERERRQNVVARRPGSLRNRLPTFVTRCLQRSTGVSMSTLDERVVSSQYPYWSGSELIKHDLRIADGEVLEDREVVEQGQLYNLCHGESPEVFDAPESFQGKMLDFQEVGMNFLISLRNNGLNGILADDMGLGKTIQTIAFLLYVNETERHKSDEVLALIVVPLSTLPNWQDELKRFGPSLDVLTLHGKALERIVQKRRMTTDIRYDIVLTTPEILMRDNRDISKIRFKCLIVDEAHRLKNMKSRLHKALVALGIPFRLLLTGTPLQNNLGELFSLLHFLAPLMFRSRQKFMSWFQGPNIILPPGSKFQEEFDRNRSLHAIAEEVELFNRFHIIMRPFVMRRTKEAVLKKLPGRDEIIVRLPLTPWQEIMYDKLCTGDPIRKKGGLKLNLNNLAMQLRKAVNHPFIFEDEYDLNWTLYGASSKFETLDRLLLKLMRREHKVLVFTQFAELISIIGQLCDYRGYPYLRLDGSVNVSDRRSRIETFNRNASGFDIFLISTRAGGCGINLQAADTVIIFDSDWNPQQDEQAIARSHRLGQNNIVKVIRLITITPIEEGILKANRRKIEMDKKLIQSGRFGNVDEYDTEELREVVTDAVRARNQQDLKHSPTPLDIVNRFLARTRSELEFFRSVDADKLGDDCLNPSSIHLLERLKKSGRLMLLEDIPSRWTAKTDQDQTNEGLYGRGQRKRMKRTEFYYSTVLSDSNFERAMEVAETETRSLLDCLEEAYHAAGLGEHEERKKRRST